jgi:hypothetical protein
MAVLGYQQQHIEQLRWPEGVPVLGTFLAPVW